MEPVFRLLLLGGLRRGEALGLRWRDVDLDNRLITVRQQIVQVGGELVINPPKSRRGLRTVSVDPTTLASAGTPGLLRSAEGLVFSGTDGAPLSPALVSRRFERLVAELGLPRIRLHDLRHTSASLGLAAGESLVEVSRRLGHSSVAITGDIYSHLDPTLTRASADRLARLLQPPARSDPVDQDPDPSVPHRSGCGHDSDTAELVESVLAPASSLDQHHPTAAGRAVGVALSPVRQRHPLPPGRSWRWRICWPAGWSRSSCCAGCSG